MWIRLSICNSNVKHSYQLHAGLLLGIPRGGIYLLNKMGDKWKALRFECRFTSKVIRSGQWAIQPLAKPTSNVGGDPQTLNIPSI